MLPSYCTLYIRVHRRFTVKLYPNQAARALFETWRSHCRFVWNIALEQRLDAWKKGKFPSKFDQSRQLTELKQDELWLRETPAYMLKEVLGSLDTAMKRCWKKTARCPQFKSTKRDDNVQMFYGSKGVCLKNGFLKVPFVGLVRFRGIKQSKIDAFGNKLKSFSLIKRAGNWYASLLFEIDHVAPSQHKYADKIVGLDKGITHLIADSDGNLVENPRFYAKAMKALARAQRVLSRRKKGSRRRLKAKNAVQRVHRRIANQRHDFLHRLSTTYAKNHGVVVVEDLRPSRMLHWNRGVSRSILDAAWSTFDRMLEYKLEQRSGRLVRVNPAYTSQACFACGFVAKENREGKQFRCVQCTHEDDADLNAARNVLRRGLDALAENHPVRVVVEGAVTHPLKRETAEAA